MKIFRLFSFGLGFGLGLISASATTIYDDFNDGEDLNPLWILVDAGALAGAPGTRSFGPANTEYQLQGAALASIRPDFVMTDGVARVELKRWNPGVSGGSSVGLVVRFNPDFLSGYFMSIDFDGSPSVNLVRLDAGGSPGISAGGATLVYDELKTYVLEAVVSGGTIVGRVYEKNGDTETLFDEVTLNDPAAFTAGVCGLLVAQDTFPGSTAPGDATFDDFFAADGVVEQPELVGITAGDGVVTFGVKGEAGRPYLVEYKPGVDAALWNTLTNFPPMSLPGANLVTDVDNQPQRIYRASTPAD